MHISPVPKCVNTVDCLSKQTEQVADFSKGHTLLLVHV